MPKGRGFTVCFDKFCISLTQAFINFIIDPSYEKRTLPHSYLKRPDP